MDRTRRRSEQMSPKATVACETAHQASRAQAADLAQHVSREAQQADPDWSQIGELAQSLATLARAEAANAWMGHAEKLREFATSVFIECRDRLSREPRCLPVLGAAGSGSQVTIRGLVHSSGATLDYAEEMLTDLMVELFAQGTPACGAIAFRTLSVPDEEELLVIVAVEGESRQAACFIGPQPNANPAWPHLVAENPLPQHAQRIEELEMLFLACDRPSIDVGNRTYWKTWLTRGAGEAAEG